MKKIFIALATTSLLITSNAQISTEEAEIAVSGEAIEEANLISNEAITAAANEEFVSEGVEIIPPTTTEEIFYPAEEVTMVHEEGELSDNDDGNGDDTDTDPDSGNTVSPGFLGGKILATSASAFIAMMTLIMM